MWPSRVTQGQRWAALREFSKMHFDVDDGTGLLKLKPSEVDRSRLRIDGAMDPNTFFCMMWIGVSWLVGLQADR